MKKTDVLIVGGGPAGSACAMMLADAGVSVTLLDKASFPRDKICGDALSPDVLNQLVQVRPDLRTHFDLQDKKQRINGMRLVAPSGVHFDLMLNSASVKLDGFVMSRMEFDRTLNEEVRKTKNIDLHEGVRVKKCMAIEGGMRVETDKGEWNTRMLVGADGAHSVVAKQLAGFEMDRKHYCAALRVYYENVDWADHEADVIELHFLSEVSPGYLWVFPMEGNKANVGIGMLSEYVSKKNVNLKEELEKAIATHPRLAPRFKNARALESIKGFGIPLGSKKFPLSGDHFLLTGDAASLVDPVSGEGIANALRSGRFAADHIQKALKADRFDASFNSSYDKRLYKAIWAELRISRFIQKLFTSPKRVEWVTRMISQNKVVQRTIDRWLFDDHFMTHWNEPSYYWRKWTGQKKNPIDTSDPVSVLPQK